MQVAEGRATWFKHDKPLVTGNPYAIVRLPKKKQAENVSREEQHSTHELRKNAALALV